MSIDLNAPSTSISPCLTADTTQVTGGSPDGAPSGLTKVGPNPIQTCHEFKSSYPITLPRVPGADLAGLNTTVDGMMAYDSTNGGIAVLSNSAWGGVLDVKRATFTLTRANILAMYGTAILLLPNIAGKVYMVHQASFAYNYGTSAIDDGGDIVLQYDDNAQGAGTNALSGDVDAALISGAVASGVTFLSGSNGAVLQNVSADELRISNKTAAFTDADGLSTGTLEVNIWYSILSFYE